MKKVIVFAAAILAMAACNKNVIDGGVEAGYGYIDLGISSDTEMVVTKADGDGFGGYNVTLKKDGKVMEGWPKEYAEAIADAELWKLEKGNYSVYVENLTVAETYETEAGVVRVAGETAVTVVAGVSTDCTVNCTPVNTKVSFAYTTEFDTVFDTPSVTVAGCAYRSEDVEMTIATSHLEDNAVYFEPAELTWTLKAYINSVEKTYSKPFTTQLGKWSQITFTTGSTDGEISLIVTVDGEITDIVEIDAVIDPITGDITQTEKQPSTQE